MASPQSAITSSNGIGALGPVSANNPLRNLETVLKVACMAIGVRMPKSARLVAKVKIRLWPIRKRT